MAIRIQEKASMDANIPVAAPILCFLTFLDSGKPLIPQQSFGFFCF
jgi:hypothetical protein